MPRAFAVLLSLFAALSLASAQEPALPDGYTPLVETPNPQYDLRLSVEGDLPLSLVFAASDSATGYQLDLHPRGSKLRRLDNPSGDIARGPGRDSVRELTLRRREAMVYVLADGQRLLSAFDGTQAAGWVGLRAGDAATVTVVEDGYQPVEEIYFTDDFMRTEDQQELGVWTHGAGEWRFYSVSETNPDADADRSVNPFSLGLKPTDEQPAMVFAGQNFWDDYELSVAVKGLGAGWAGIIFAAQTPQDFWLLRAELSGWPPAARRIELVRVVGGEETVVAGGTAALASQQWYKLGVRLRGDRLACLLDEDPIFERVDPSLAGGRIGLWTAPLYVEADDTADETAAAEFAAAEPEPPAEGEDAAEAAALETADGPAPVVAVTRPAPRLLPQLAAAVNRGIARVRRLVTAPEAAAEEQHEALFDDVRCLTNLDWTLDRGADLRSAGAPAGGEWAVVDVAGRPIDGDPGRQGLAATGAGTARYVLGDPAGGAWRFDATVTPAAAGLVGLLYGWRDEANYGAAVWDPSGTVSLVEVADGEKTVLGSATDTLLVGAPQELSLDLLEPGQLQVRRGDRLVLRAAREGELPAGRLGLTTTGAGAGFEGLRLRQWVTQFSELEVDNDVFANDPFMLNWASTLADWYPAGGPENNPAWAVPPRERADEASGGPEQFWHKGDFLGAYRLSLPVGRGPLAVLLNAPFEAWDPLLARAAEDGPVTGVGPGAGEGYAVTLNDGAAEGAPAWVGLYRDGLEVGRAELPADSEQFEVHHDGTVTWVAAAGADLIVHHDPAPPAGTRVALWLARPGALWDVRAARTNVLDEVFEAAPADWLEQGDWTVTNRFTCMPTWSHMTGLARDSLAALWSKYGFTGDTTIEYYAGSRMQSDLAYYYPRVGEFNLTFAAPPGDLAEGISLLPAAWDAGWTGRHTLLAQGERTLAETFRPLAPSTRENTGSRQVPVPFVASGRDVHGAWYYLKARRLGERVEGYFDNVKVLEATAPATGGDRLAFWTQDNEIVISRVRVTFTERVVPRRLLSMDRILPPAPEASTLQAKLAGQPSLAYDWVGSRQGWQPRTARRGLTVEPQTRDGRSFLLVTNRLPGDTFEVVAPLDYKPATATPGFRLRALPETGVGLDPFWQRRLDDGSLEPTTDGAAALDLQRAAHLAFDYALAPATKVNLYLTIGGQRYFVPLSGPRESSPLLRRLGEPREPVVADGEWHRFHLNLGPALRNALGSRPAMLTDLSFGAEHEGYLRAGFGGNPAGAWYALANFELVPELAAENEFWPFARRIDAEGRPQVDLAGLRYSLDDQPQGTPPADGAPPARLPAEPGRYWVHLQGVDAAGVPTAVVHLPVQVAAAQPPLVAVEPADGWCGEQLVLAPSGEWPNALSVRTGAADARSDVGPVTWSVVGEQIVIDLPAPATPYEDGQQVPFEVNAVYPSGGSSTVELTRVYRLADDDRPPSRPELTGVGPELWPSAADAARLALNGYVTVEHDPSSERVPGEGSLLVTNRRLAASMPVGLFTSEQDLGRTPVLLLDYQIDAPIRTDLNLVTRAGNFVVALFDGGAGAGTTIGRVRGAVRDGTWQRAVVPLRTLVGPQTEILGSRFGLSQLSLADGGYSGAAPGATYRIGAARLVREVSGSQGFTIGWRAADAGGIGGWRYGLSADESARPAVDLPAETTELTFTEAPEGLVWFSLQAVDRAGNASDVVRAPLLVRSLGPTLLAPEPAPGPLGLSALTVPVRGGDSAILDAAQTTVSVNGVETPLTQGRLRPAANGLLWRWAWGLAQFGQPVADGTPVRFKLRTADHAGNPPSESTWDYRVDYASDTEPPPAPEVIVADQPLEMSATYNPALGARPRAWSGYGSGREVALDEERQDWVLACRTGGGGVALRIGQPYDLTAYPYLSFDYKVVENTRLHLLVNLNTRWETIQLSGRGSQPELTQHEDWTQDSTWQTAFFDLGALVRAKYPEGELKVEQLLLAEAGSPNGLDYALDNVAVFGLQPARELAASWTAYDASGIAGGGAALQAGLGGGEPPAADGAGDGWRGAAAEAGVHLLRVRVRDGAGQAGGEARRVVVTP